ncbi:hypothetical protein M569_11605 [Genlisea aurea]|uniref:X8 domain-containing protein n=1 Tax=Genlisea aurea TaxID=192259 RepID=S8C8I5_9LAMI|nr:hypothetical protein M569_11605 [Genlisea aurea]
MARNAIGFVVFASLWLLAFDPYFDSPFSIPPLDSFPPFPAPVNSPPYCINPPPSGINSPPYFYPTNPPLRNPPSPAIPPPPSGINSPPYFYSPTNPPPPSPPSPAIPSPPYSPPAGEFRPPIGPSPIFLPPIVYPPPSVPPPPYIVETPAMWCVAKASVPDPIVEEAMNYACGSGADCADIQPGGSCFEPDTLFAHASYAFNSYWQRTKAVGATCDFGGTALLVTVDPSYDGCHFYLY